jgi:hypothetical protein
VKELGSIFKNFYALISINVKDLGA